MNLLIIIFYQNYSLPINLLLISIYKEENLDKNAILMYNRLIIDKISFPQKIYNKLSIVN